MHTCQELDCASARCIFNSLRPRRNGCYNADDIFKCIFLKENVWIPTKISLKFVPKGPINNIPALVQIMAWRRPGDKPLSEPMMVSLLTHICVTRPQWVNIDLGFLRREQDGLKWKRGSLSAQQLAKLWLQLSFYVRETVCTEIGQHTSGNKFY